MDNVKNDVYYVKRMLKSVETITRYMQGRTQDDLLTDGFLCDAVENRFVKLAEDSGKLSLEFRQRVDAPWFGIRSIRNRVAHDYDVVDEVTIYKTVVRDFPPFRETLLATVPHHELRLNPEPFEVMSRGKKTVEMRLNEPKRQCIKTGDLIRFTNTETGEQLLAEVEELRPFSTFDELYRHYEPEALGYERGSKANPKDMLVYYRQSDIDRWGVLAIEIRLY